jgi:guanine deaminase
VLHVPQSPTYLPPALRTMATAYYGPVINPLSLTDYLSLPQCLILVSSEGNIEEIYEDVQNSQVQELLVKHDYTGPGVSFTQLKDGKFLMPGFIDTHTVRHCVA